MKKTFDKIKQDLIKDKDYITYEELAYALKGLKLNSDEVDELYSLLNENKITVVSESSNTKPVLFDNNKLTNINSLLYAYLKDKIITTIENWQELDIYAISLFLNTAEEGLNITLGYNTESNVTRNIPDASDVMEARWNYAFWLQNIEFYFEVSDKEEIKKWIKDKEAYFAKNYDNPSTEEFTVLLIEIVQEIHKFGILTKKFGKEIPILIHELEYTEKTAVQNIKANGRELIEDFIDFCNPILYARNGKLERAFDI